MQLMRNWRDQMVAQVKGERNHPSVMIWSIENEWLYINCINLYGGLMDEFEAETARTSDAVMAADPTRPTMTDGGGAGKANAMPVAGDHYVFGDYPKYPDLAYDANPTGGGRGRWVWDQQRPRFIGEDYFANGINPFDYSYFGGEETFQGKAQARRAAGIIFRMLTEGYRWAGIRRLAFLDGTERGDRPVRLQRRRSPSSAGNGTGPSPPGRRSTAPCGSSTTAASSRRSPSASISASTAGRSPTETASIASPPAAASNSRSR